MRPDPNRLRDHLGTAMVEQTVRIVQLVEQCSRLGEWVALPLPEDIREHLRGDLRRAADELTAALVAWHHQGGKLTLTPPPVELPAPPPPPAPPIKVVTAAEPPPAPTGPPASVDAISKLANHFKTAPAFAPEPPSGWEDELVSALSTLGSPAESDDAELEHMLKVLDRIDKWKVFPRTIQRDMVGLCTCRLRRLQDERGFSVQRLDEGFSTLSGWSRREQPGYVNGLSRGHVPTRGSWTEDAEAFMLRLQAPVAALPKPNLEKLVAAVETVIPELASAPSPDVFEAVRAQLRRVIRAALDGGVPARDPRLVRLATPFVNELDGTEYRALRRAIREESEESDAEEEKAPPALPADWAWWGRTRGRRGILVGGDPREPNRVRLQEVFGFSELVWEPAEHRRNSLLAVRERVRAGKVDIVVILGAFVGHDADEIILPACRENNVDWVHLDKGYGVVRMRRAVERFLDPLRG